MGEVKWAKAQFDALKQSTSKLLANDAIEKSILINNQSSTENSFEVLKKYSNIEYLIFQKKHNNALVLLDKLLSENPTHSLSENIYWLKYTIYDIQNNREKAILNLNKIISENGVGFLIPKAILAMAYIKEKTGKIDQAIELYNKLIKEYSSSVYSIEAIEKLEKHRTIKKDV
jgi:tetratricopeptide (TPR) repeat protein